MKQKLITDYFNVISSNKRIRLENNVVEIVLGYNPKKESWHCIGCGIDMGLNNPRQLCRKTYCENTYY